MKKLRTKFIIFMYENSQKQYRKYFKKKKRQWQFNEEQLLSFKEDSLGRMLGEFYYNHGFRMIPKMENHDVYHLITDFSTNIQDEIAMQYLLFGNGKRSAYLLGVLALGTIIFPEYFKTYLKAFRKGQNMRVFHHWDFERLLWQNFEHLKDFIRQKETQVLY
ncbi:ubiquinone biosynthesis protein COQ4 [Chryseobacterium sp. SSA4.19]|uniref:ubiquinone biosynthesis protein COQ4 n=1 Tax=Chryseobacterium sp. SSA4.19 TaxID=2919915 RepID=UPI001F4E2DB9|nr:ubiquinone biosynthesis protein COQ4 [Chryseobacterium sp. SSA4.19]MCJ8154211.1 ubiquinone biosynthesis protein COQ4 [Chryseobacterium sp. SSA4.19]